MTASPDFNQIVDETIKNVVKLINTGDKSIGLPVLDPFAVPELTYHFKVAWFPGTVYFYNMTLGGLNTLARTGDCSVDGDDLTVELGFNSLGFTGTYGINFFPLNDIGEFASGVVTPSVSVHIHVSTLPKLKLTLTSLELHYVLIGFVTIGANPIVDVAFWLMSAIGTFLGNTFKPILSNAIAPYLRMLLQGQINRVIPDVMG